MLIPSFLKSYFIRPIRNFLSVFDFRENFRLTQVFEILHHRSTKSPLLLFVVRSIFKVTQYLFWYREEHISNNYYLYKYKTTGFFKIQYFKNKVFFLRPPVRETTFESYWYDSLFLICDNKNLFFFENKNKYFQF